MNRTIFSITVVDDAGMKKVNKRWFGKDTTTDVISFSLEQTPMQRQNSTDSQVEETLEIQPLVAGEIVVNEDEVRRNANQYNVSFEQEMARVVAHGVLHIYGYEDDTPEHRRAMKALEDTVVHDLKK